MAGELRNLLQIGSCVCGARLRSCISSIMRVRSVVIENSFTRGTLRAGSNTILPRARASDALDYVDVRIVPWSETRAGFKEGYPALNTDTPPA